MDSRVQARRQTVQPRDGLAGLRDHWKDDMFSGFIVFLLALPLSLGIAKASDFPPLMGLVTAIIGGILISFISGSVLTIKGPAAGLIVIVTGAVAEFGGGEQGWHLALFAIFAAGVLQILFGVLRWGKLVDFFPLSAIHGMLAAIGLTIIAKQLPVLMNVDPALIKGGPIALFSKLPMFISHADLRASAIGMVCLAILLIWPKLKISWPKKIPAPVLVLAIAIPAQLLLNFQQTEPKYALVHIGHLMDNIKVNIDFSMVGHWGAFAKYVVMFALVGSLESLLTVKAIDLMDPAKRKSNNNKDLMAIGLGNMMSSVLGGLPMISEVARSSSNVANHAKTRWANFFHGMFVLIFVLFASDWIELIPNCALAAMLIAVGIKLAHPKEFMHMFKIGKEQLLIFMVTIALTLFEDLLVGIAAGMLTKILIHMVNGASVTALFKAPIEVSFSDDVYEVKIDKAAIFTNFMSIKAKLSAIPAGMNVVIDLQHTDLVDHSVMENLEQFKHDYEAKQMGGQVDIIGLDEHVEFSDHPTAARKRVVAFGKPIRPE